MNVPLKNITKIDTSKGVPVWKTSMSDIRAYAEIAKDNAEKQVIQSDMQELVTLIKNHFLNGRDIGANTILLSIACINFLLLKSKKQHVHTFLMHVAERMFNGVAYTGNSAKVVTVTRDTQVPVMLPFVLREKDTIVAGYGVYVVRYTFHEKFKNENEKIFSFLFDTDAPSDKDTTDQNIRKIFPHKINTLYNDYEITEEDIENSAKNGTPIYMLCTRTKGEIEDLAAKQHSWLHVCTQPILTIGTHDLTKQSFREVGPSLAWAVRSTNSSGLVATVATTGTQKKRSGGSLECDDRSHKTQKTSTSTVTTVPDKQVSPINPWDAQIKTKYIALNDRLHPNDKNTSKMELQKNKEYSKLTEAEKVDYVEALLNDLEAYYSTIPITETRSTTMNTIIGEINNAIKNNAVLAAEELHTTLEKLLAPNLITASAPKKNKKV